MKFVSTHLTWHHATHTPHRFLLALLLSPIHAAELHYERRYRLNYVHAKKLFFFDLFLVLFMLALVGGIIGWRLYNPGTTDLVEVTVTTDSTRLKSGDHITLTATVHNRHDYSLYNSSIHFDISPTIVLDSDASTTISLGTIRANETKEFSLRAHAYAALGNDAHVLAHVTYRPAIRTRAEEKIAPLLIRPVESVLGMTLVSPTALIPDNATPVSIQLTNNGDVPLTVTVPLDFGTLARIDHVTPSTGTTTPHEWIIPALPPQATATIFFDLTVPDTGAETFTLQSESFVSVANESLTARVVKVPVQLVRPHIDLQTSWQNTGAIIPGSVRDLTVTVRNNGVNPLQHIVLRLPAASSLIDSARLTPDDTRTWDGLGFVLTSSTLSGLAELSPGTTVSRIIHLPIRALPLGSERMTFAPTVRLEASTPLVPNTLLTQTARAESLPVASVLTLVPELRYYTSEGDQLGRGPLPPTVGKTTKYLALITLTNNTNDVSAVTVESRLAPGIVWTGKKSVSAGKDMSMDTTGQNLTWQIYSLAPHEQAVASFEVAITPSEDQIGTTPTLIEHISVTAHDEFTGNTLSSNAAPLTIAIPTDALGRARGITVK